MEYLHRQAALSRKGFLTLGATGVATAAASALGPAAALAAPQPPAPQGDDLGFLAFGAVAETNAVIFYRTALATPGLFDAGDRARPGALRACWMEHGAGAGPRPARPNGGASSASPLLWARPL